MKKAGFPVGWLRYSVSYSIMGKKQRDLSMEHPFDTRYQEVIFD
jgi:hypothetical protein